MAVSECTASWVISNSDTSSCVDRGKDMCRRHMRISIEMYIAMRTDMCIGMCMEMCIDMCIDMCIVLCEGKCMACLQTGV